MQLVDIEKSRSGLLQFLVVLIMIFLGLIMALAARQTEGYAIEALTVLSLGACLYVLSRERTLKNREAELLSRVMSSKRQAHWLGQKLEQERAGATGLETRLRELTSLYRAISTVNAIGDPTSTFEAVMNASLDLVGGDCASIMLLDAAGETLTLVDARGLPEHVTGTQQAVGTGVAGRVIERQEPLLVSGTLSDDDELKPKQPRALDLNVSISCPLTLHGQPIGVLNVGSSVNGQRKDFSEYDLRAVTIFAQHAAIAIEYARLNGLIASKSTAQSRPQLIRHRA